MIREIAPSKIRVGMYVHKLDSGWLETPFWRTQLLITKQTEVAEIHQAKVKRIWIDTTKGVDVEEVKPPAEAAARIEAAAAAGVASAVPAVEASDKARIVVPTGPQSLEKELEIAAGIKSRAREAISTMFAEARLGVAPRLETTVPIVEEISGSLQRNRSALTSLVRLKSQDDYTFLHSVAVCTLMVTLALELNLSEDEVRVAGLAGLLHDIGKMQIPLEILNKPGKLTEEEFEVVKAHPRAGAELLSATPDMEAGAIDVCLHHHERIDGKGYPDKLSDAAITRVVRMSSICDVYDAVTSDRPYKKAWTPGIALQEMASWRRGAFDESIFQAFVRSVGVYPIGSLVKLESGRLAVVVDQNEDLLRPRVKAMYDIKAKQLTLPEVVDLAGADCGDRITGRESPERWTGVAGIDRFWLPPAVKAKA